MTIDLSAYGYTKRAIYVNSVLSLRQPELDLSSIEHMKIKKGDRGCGIYGIFNLQTKGLYVGSTSDFHKRIIGHESNIKTGRSYRLINADMKLTGLGAFVFIKIHEVKPHQLIDAENFWMSSLSTTYNEHKAYELKIPIESKRRGRKDSLVTIAHYSSPVVKYSIDNVFIKEYPSIRAAAVEHGGKHLAYLITKSCRGKIDSALDGIWKYKNGMTPSKPKWVKSLIDKSAIQINAETGDFIKLWDSIKEAAVFYGLEPHSIRRVCKTNKVAGGFFWRYANIKTFANGTETV